MMALKIMETLFYQRFRTWGWPLSTPGARCEEGRDDDDFSDPVRRGGRGRRRRGRTRDVAPGKSKLLAYDYGDSSTRGGSMEDYQDFIETVEIGTGEKVKRDLKTPSRRAVS